MNTPPMGEISSTLLLLYTHIFSKHRLCCPLMADQTSTAALNMKSDGLRVNQGTHVDGEMVEGIKQEP